MELPDGWTLARVREVSQCPTAETRPADTPVALETYPYGNNTQALRVSVAANVIIDFAGLFLVQPAGEAEWYMGQEHNGEVVCWASYGDDLESAINSL